MRRAYAYLYRVEEIIVNLQIPDEAVQSNGGGERWRQKWRRSKGGGTGKQAALDSYERTVGNHHSRNRRLIRTDHWPNERNVFHDRIDRGIDEENGL
jgi:hypothetical protein